jgi:hypothetical protein
VCKGDTLIGDDWYWENATLLQRQRIGDDRLGDDRALLPDPLVRQPEGLADLLGESRLADV